MKTMIEKYIRLCIFSLLLGLISLSLLPLYSVAIFNVGNNQTYTTVQPAITAALACTTDTVVEVRIFTGTYTNPATYQMNFTGLSIIKLSIIGMDGRNNCILSCSSSNVHIFNVVGQANTEFCIRGVTLKYADSVTPNVGSCALNFCNGGKNISITDNKIIRFNNCIWIHDNDFYEQDKLTIAHNIIVGYNSNSSGIHILPRYNNLNIDGNDISVIGEYPFSC